MTDEEYMAAMAEIEAMMPSDEVWDMLEKRYPPPQEWYDQVWDMDVRQDSQVPIRPDGTQTGGPGPG